eukprot:CAMPEP_0185789884 /NCGR_PEP_ID=MMETSP1174-20130828/153310_1 /TAXON_ID=35687 /ORGANISM="Dictyocha speculum, Strain CCMP1381" /LENGTH=125 /DNA_ID=CAMNT_0028484239 /DNA_START=11 /DNA_END=385 /DNA_ORIENTATION=-
MTADPNRSTDETRRAPWFLKAMFKSGPSKISFIAENKHTHPNREAMTLTSTTDSGEKHILSNVYINKGNSGVSQNPPSFDGVPVGRVLPESLTKWIAEMLSSVCVVVDSTLPLGQPGAVDEQWQE